MILVRAELSHIPKAADTPGQPFVGQGYREKSLIHSASTCDSAGADWSKVYPINNLKRAKRFNGLN